MSDRVIFLYPGIGDHQGLAGTGLLMFPEYRHIITRGYEHLRDKHEIDLFWTLEPAPSSATAHARKSGGGFSARLKQARSKSTQTGNSANINTDTDTDTDRLQQTLYAHPFLFLHHMALTSLLKAHQITPHSCIGYSLGEYSAATACGAMSFYQALDLIATRARLVHQLPRAEMLAIAADSSLIDSHLPPDVSIAAANSPLQTIVAGPEKAMSELKPRLDAERIIYQPVRADHGFHTSLLNSVKSPLSHWIQDNLHGKTDPLNRDWISSIDLSEHQRGTPFPHDYWLTQLVSPVAFTSISRKLAHRSELIIETGPGRSLSLLLKQNPDFPQRQWHRLKALVPSINEGQDHRTTMEQQLQLIKDSLAAGESVAG